MANYSVGGLKKEIPPSKHKRPFKKSLNRLQHMHLDIEETLHMDSCEKDVPRICSVFTHTKQSFRSWYHMEQRFIFAVQIIFSMSIFDMTIKFVVIIITRKIWTIEPLSRIFKGSVIYKEKTKLGFSNA